MPPDFVQQIINAGGNIALEQTYPPHLVTEWVELAVKKGVSILVTGPYPPHFPVQWARIGGRNFTYKVPKAQSSPG